MGINPDLPNVDTSEYISPFRGLLETDGTVEQLQYNPSNKLINIKFIFDNLTKEQKALLFIGGIVLIWALVQ